MKTEQACSTLYSESIEEQTSEVEEILSFSSEIISAGADEIISKGTFKIVRRMTVQNME